MNKCIWHCTRQKYLLHQKIQQHQNFFFQLKLYKENVIQYTRLNTKNNNNPTTKAPKSILRIFTRGFSSFLVLALKDATAGFLSEALFSIRVDVSSINVDDFPFPMFLVYVLSSVSSGSLPRCSCKTNANSRNAATTKNKLVNK